ncbi:hypothetical protein DKP78_24060, partial [Enterococcus faecium]
EIAATGGTDVSTEVPRKFDRVALSEALKTGRSRMLYFGHVSARPDEPGSASIHLFDTAGGRTSGNGMWGMAAVVRPPMASG